MYQPTRQIVNSGFANLDFSEGLGHRGAASQFAQSYLAAQERKYKETNDYYDLQRQDMDDMAKVLEGATGADFVYLNQKLLEKREEYKALLKDTTLKDYRRNAALQEKLFEIKNDLAKAKNLSVTSLEQIKNVYAQIKSGDNHIKSAEAESYLKQQLSLPPDQRDPDLANKIIADPLFFNAYDYTSQWLGGRKKMEEVIERKSKNFYDVYKAEFAPELGRFVNGEWVFDPRDESLDSLLENPAFYNTMVGMLPAEVVKELEGSGNKSVLDKAVRDQTKQYLQEVFLREGSEFGPKLTLQKRNVDPQMYAQKPTSNERKMDEEVLAIQQRLQNGHDRAFDEYLSPDGWQQFEIVKDENGRVTGISASLIDKNNILYGMPGARPIIQEYIPVDPSDPGSVRQALSRIKFVYNSDKKSVQAAPMNRPKAEEAQKEKSDLKSSYTIKGKKYTLEQLKNLGYTEDQIREAIKLGTIK